MTVRYWGYAAVENVAGEILAVYPSWLDIEALSPTSSFSYSYIGTPDDPYLVQLVPQASSVTAGASTTPFFGAPAVQSNAIDTEAYVYQITWGEGFQSQILELEAINDPATGLVTYYYFQLGGVPLRFESLEEYAAMSDGFVLSHVTTPGLTPGAAIPFTGIPGAQQITAGTPGIDRTASGPETIVGGAGDDTLTGSAGGDRLQGQGGNDLIYGGDGADQLLGNAGADVIYGGAGNDNISASDDDDLAFGGAGIDSIGGGLGSDQIYGGADNDVVTGGQGNDFVDGGDGNDFVGGGFGDDTIYGGAGNDNLAGGAGLDYVFGGTGHDDMGGGFGNDWMFGGDGNDTMGGGDGNDRMYGGAGDDRVNGGAGQDSLYGGDGADRLNGGAGNDWLYGGAGADVFVFNTYFAGTVDRIMDFTHGEDRIQLAGISGPNAAARFASLSITAAAEGVNIAVGGQTIFVAGSVVGDFDAGDFIFV